MSSFGDRESDFYGAIEKIGLWDQSQTHRSNHAFALAGQTWITPAQLMEVWGRISAGKARDPRALMAFMISKDLNRLRSEVEGTATAMRHKRQPVPKSYKPRTFEDPEAHPQFSVEEIEEHKTQYAWARLSGDRHTPAEVCNELKITNQDLEVMLQRHRTAIGSYHHAVTPQEIQVWMTEDASARATALREFLRNGKQEVSK